MRSPSLTTTTPNALQALRPQPFASTHADGADNYPIVKLPPREFTDADILSVICDLFAGRTARAFGEPIDWWTETLQCDLPPTAAAAVALTAISKWQFDRDAGAAGVKQLQDELVLRARQILGKGGQP